MDCQNSSNSDMTPNSAKKRRIDYGSRMMAEANGCGLRWSTSPLTQMTQPITSTQTISSSEDQIESQNKVPSSESPIGSDVSEVVTPEVTQMCDYFKDDSKYADKCLVCRQPSLQLNGEECVKCEVCEHEFHLKCVDLSQRIHDMMKGLKTVKWICDICLDRDLENRPFLRMI